MTYPPPHYYAQPPPWQPPPPKRDWVRTSLWITLGVVGVAVLAVAWLWFFYTPEQTISEDKVRTSVEAELKSQGYDASITEFTCPKMVANKGETYMCSAKIDGTPAKITVTVQDDEGSIFWEVAGY